MISWKVRNLQNRARFQYLPHTASTDVNLFGNCLHNKINHSVRARANVNRKKTLFRGQALHVFQGFDVLRMFVRMFGMHTEYELRTVLTNIQPLY